jgi:hypothetical protein
MSSSSRPAATPRIALFAPPSTLALKPVAAPEDGDDVAGLSRVDLDFPPQMLNMHVNHPASGI